MIRMKEQSELEKRIDRQMRDLEKDREEAAEKPHRKRNIIITVFSVLIALSMLIRMFL